MKLRSQLKKNLFLVFFIAALLMLFFYQERKHYDLISDKDLNIIHDKLKVLSLQEKKDLAYFFNHALIFCEFPYTLVASKPMSICNYLQASEDLPQILREDYERPIHREFADKLERGYQVFDKYNSLFPLKNYIILRYHASNSKGMNEVALIHRQICMDVIQENLDEFCKVLQQTYTSEEILEMLTHPDHENFYKIIQNHRLLGILLGFGRNNARLFEDGRHDILQSFSKEWPYWPRKWRLPGFASDPTTEETEHLKKTYERARKFIRWTYWNRNELEVTLALLSLKE